MRYSHWFYFSDDFTIFFEAVWIICSLTISTDYPDGSHETFEYDRLNRLTAHIDELGAKIAYELALDGLPLKRTHFVWDGSRLLQEIHSDGRYTYIYADSNSYEPLYRYTTGSTKTAKAANKPTTSTATKSASQER